MEIKKAVGEIMQRKRSIIALTKEIVNYLNREVRKIGLEVVPVKRQGGITELSVRRVPREVGGRRKRKYKRRRKRKGG